MMAQPGVTGGGKKLAAPERPTRWADTRVAAILNGGKPTKVSMMSVSYTNRKGTTYYLCLGTTKTGAARYYFACSPRGVAVTRVPEGYRIQESVNGVVSLSKSRPSQISDGEIGSVKAAIQKHPRGKHYRAGIKSTLITIYERVGPDFEEMAATLGIGRLSESKKRRLEELERERAQFAPIMRFRLSDPLRRLFTAERMCFMGAIDDWITVEYDKPIDKLSAKLIPVLGTDGFFELA